MRDFIGKKRRCTAGVQEKHFIGSFEKTLGWPTYKRIGLKHAAYKILAGEDNRILGAHFLADNVGGMVQTIRLAMINGLSADDLYRQCIMSPYPTRESDLIYMLEPFRGR